MEEELSPRERELIAALQPEIEPDPVLRDRVVADLRRANLLAPRRARLLLAVAAALIFGFAGGLLVPHLRPQPAQQREFMLFVHDTPSMHTDGNEADRVREYSEWARGLQNKLVDGEKLTDAISSVGPNPEHTTVGGFFRVRAHDRAEAEAIARSCPHVRHGGWIEVREIERI
jgi:hypothetical protein